MRRIPTRLFLLALLTFAAPGCNRNSGETGVADAQPPKTTRKPANTPDEAKKDDKTPSSESVSEARAAVQAFLDADAKKAHPVLPKGTDLISIKVDGSVATLDMNSAFNGLKTMGESGESEAQKALRKALTPVKNLEKMRVTVEGKPFDSDATDWQTPFDIRESSEGP